MLREVGLSRAVGGRWQGAPRGVWRAAAGGGGRERMFVVRRLQGARLLAALRVVRRHIRAPEGRARPATEPLGGQGVLSMGVGLGARSSEFSGRCGSVCR